QSDGKASNDDHYRNLPPKEPRDPAQVCNICSSCRVHRSPRILQYHRGQCGSNKRIVQSGCREKNSWSGALGVGSIQGIQDCWRCACRCEGVGRAHASAIGKGAPQAAILRWAPGSYDKPAVESLALTTATLRLFLKPCSFYKFRSRMLWAIWEKH